MAGLGDNGRGATRRRRGLAEEVAEKMEAQVGTTSPEELEVAGTLSEASETTEPPRQLPDVPSGTPAPVLQSVLEKAPAKVKGSWYVSVELSDRLRDACEFLDQAGYRINGGKVSVGELVEPVIQAHIERLWDQHNNGVAFPTSIATKASRMKRRRR